MKKLSFIPFDIRTKVVGFIIIFLLISVGGAALLGYSVYQFSKERLTELWAEELAIVATARKGDIEHTLSEWRHEIDQITRQNNLHLTLAEALRVKATQQDPQLIGKIRQIISTNLEQSTRIRRIALCDLSNQQILTLSTAPGGALSDHSCDNYQGQDDWLAQNSSPGGQITRPSIEIRNIWDEDLDNTEHNVRALVSDLIFIDNLPIAVVHIVFDGQEIWDIAHDDKGLGESGETLIARSDLNGNAQFIHPLKYHSNRGLKFTIGAKMKNMAIIRALAGKEGFVNDAAQTTMDYRGTPVLAATSYIPDLGWGIAVKIDRDEALHSAAVLLNGIIIFIIGVVILIGIIGVAFARVVAAPIMRLASIAGQIRESDLSSRDHSLTQDDLGYLAEAYGDILSAFEEQTRTLAESEARAKAVIDNTVDGIITINSDGLIEEYNPACEKIFGYTREDVIGRNVNMLMPEPYFEEHERYLRNYLHTGQKKIIGVGREVEGKRKNGTVFPIDLSISEIALANRILFCGIVRDISERKEAETALRHSVGRLQAVMNIVVDGLITINENGTIQSFNPSAEAIFGYKADEVLGKNVRMLMPSPYFDEHNHYIQNYINTGEEKIIGIGREVEAKRKDGSVFPIELGVSGMKVDNKWMFAGTIRDISARKEAEDLLHKTLEDLKQSNEDLQKFAFVASHDLKSPLRAIDNLVQWLYQDLAGALSTEHQDLMDKLRNRVKRMETLLDDLLEYSQAGGEHNYSPQVVNLSDMIEEVPSLINIPANMTLVSDPSLSNIYVPRIPLEQIFHNLIDNAVKHHDKPQGKIVISATELDEFYEFCVSDDGPGIPERFQERVFEMFQTLRPRDEVEGSGIGLALVKKITNQFGGEIEVISSEGKGALFKFTWPKVIQASKPQSPKDTKDITA